MFKRDPVSTGTRRQCAHGQSLTEFVLVLPILLLVLVAAGYIGIGMYEAHMASDAIRQPAMKKLEMAGEAGAISNGVLLGYVTGGNLQGNIDYGAPVDDVSISNTADEDLAAVIVGTKEFSVNLPPLPRFNYTVAQAVQKNLLLSAEFGAKKRPLSGWVPGGTPRQPPWMQFPSLPPGFDLLGSCHTMPVDAAVIKAVDVEKNPQKTYIAVPEVPNLPPSPIKLDNLISMAGTFAGECEGYQAGVCEAEYNHFLPEELPDIVISGGPKPTPYIKEFQYKNPPGAPGLKVSYRIKCFDEDDRCKLDLEGQATNDWRPDFELLPEIGPNHGWYFDPDSKYERPPDDFKDSCKSRKKAECQVRKALEKANEIVAAYGIECQGI